MAKSNTPATIYATDFTPKQAAAFWRRVDKRGPRDCWPWTGRSCKRPGSACYYGVAYTVSKGHRRDRPAHRVAYALHYGSASPSLVRHTCDNSTCCNPAHLEPGSPADNIADAVRRGRHRVLLRVPRTPGAIQSKIRRVLPRTLAQATAITGQRRAEFAAAIAGAFGFEMRSMNQLAQEQCLTRERIRQLVERAIKDFGEAIDKRQ